MRMQPRQSIPRPRTRRWRPADVVSLVVVVCYGAAAVVVAAGLFIRLAR